MNVQLVVVTFVVLIALVVLLYTLKSKKESKETLEAFQADDGSVFSLQSGQDQYQMVLKLAADTHGIKVDTENLSNEYTSFKTDTSQRLANLDTRTTQFQADTSSNVAALNVFRQDASTALLNTDKNMQDLSSKFNTKVQDIQVINGQLVKTTQTQQETLNTLKTRVNNVVDQQSLLQSTMQKDKTDITNATNNALSGLTKDVNDRLANLATQQTLNTYYSTLSDAIGKSNDMFLKKVTDTNTSFQGLENKVADYKNSATSTMNEFNSLKTQFNAMNATFSEANLQGIRTKFDEYLRTNDAASTYASVSNVKSLEGSLANFTTSNWVQARGYAPSNWVSSQGYASSNWVLSQGYPSSNWVLETGYAPSNWVLSQGYARKIDIASEYATKSNVKELVTSNMASAPFNFVKSDDLTKTLTSYAKTSQLTDYYKTSDALSLKNNLQGQITSLQNKPAFVPDANNKTQVKLLTNGSGIVWGDNASQIYDDANLHVKTDDNLYLDAPNTILVPKNAALQFGEGYDREVSAGQIAYGRHDGLENGTLNIIGAGKKGQSRQVQVWDSLRATQAIGVGDMPRDWRGANFKRADGRWTHFDFKDDGKNYIRGDTEVDGTLCVKDQNIAGAACVKKADIQSLGTIKSWQDTVGTHTQQISGLTSSLNNNINQLNSQVGTHTQQISGLTNSLNNNINQLNSQIGTLQSKITSIPQQGSYSKVFPNDMYLNDKGLYLREANTPDNNHGLVFSSAVDGPALHGFNGGFLGTKVGGLKQVLRWSSSNVNVSGQLCVQDGSGGECVAKTDLTNVKQITPIKAQLTSLSSAVNTLQSRSPQQGPAGPQGPPGQPGPQGPQGPPGQSSSSSLANYYNKSEVDGKLNGELKVQKIAAHPNVFNTPYPGGWGGGVHTWDLYAEGSVGVGTNGKIGSLLGRDGVLCLDDGSGGECINKKDLQKMKSTPSQGTPGPPGPPGPAAAGISGQMKNSIDFPNNGLGITWAGGYSKIYDDSQLHIRTDDHLYLDAPSAIYIPKSSALQFGDGYTKEGAAGRISYGLYDGGENGTLNIVGAGKDSASRQVRIWDSLTVNKAIGVGDMPRDWRGANFKRADGRWTHFDFKDDGKNYIRGDTIFDNSITIVNKWRLGDTGDEWLRLNKPGDASMNGYGNTGFAAGKLWTYSGQANGSDRKMKSNIEDMDANTTNNLMKLKPKSYTYKNDKDGTTRYGFIAQDVEQVYPSLVSDGPNGMKSLNYTDFIPITVANIKDMRKNIPNNKSLCIDDVCLTKNDLINIKNASKDKA